MKRINRSGLDLIKSFEDLSLEAYLDPVGVWRIGYGHTKTAKSGMKITEEEAEELLREDLKEFEEFIDTVVKVPITENQFSALVSFAYSVGIGVLRTSILLKLLNEGNIQAASDQFLRCNQSSGQKLTSPLTQRRLERNLFLKQISASHVSRSYQSSTEKKTQKLFRYPNLECPDKSTINQPFNLFVQLLLKPIELDIQELVFEDTGELDKLPEIEVVIRASGFDIRNSNFQILQLKRDDKSEVRFVLTPHDLGER